MEKCGALSAARLISVFGAMIHPHLSNPSPLQARSQAVLLLVGVYLLLVVAVVVAMFSSPSSCPTAMSLIWSYLRTPAGDFSRAAVTQLLISKCPG